MPSRQRAEVKKELANIGKSAKRVMRRRTRVDTGRLRRSLSWQHLGKLAVEWSYNTPYARWIEWGSSRFKGRTGRGDRVMETVLRERMKNIVAALNAAVARANRK